MASSKLPSGARLQITLEGRSLGFIAKSDSGFKGPRLEFRGVRDLARVVCGEALSEIGCHSDVMAPRRSLASEDIDKVKHAWISKGWLAKP